VILTSAAKLNFRSVIGGIAEIEFGLGSAGVRWGPLGATRGNVGRPMSRRTESALAFGTGGVEFENQALAAGLKESGTRSARVQFHTPEGT
jgi:hypothetical protein